MADYKHTAEMRVEHFNVLLEPQVKTHGRKQSGGSFSSKNLADDSSGCFDCARNPGDYNKHHLGYNTSLAKTSRRG